MLFKAALALEVLHKQVLPFLFRHLKEDVLNDLPPKITAASCPKSRRRFTMILPSHWLSRSGRCSAACFPITSVPAEALQPSLTGHGNYHRSGDYGLV